MILAAGLGTRLLPLTQKKPKPLFPILGQPLIDILIRRLYDSGCLAVIINTHHLAEAIDGFIKGQDYPIPAKTRHEPTILGTGGGIKNVEDFLGEAPFLVVNGDILTDIDFREVYSFHLSHKDPVTLVLHNCPQFNNVWVDQKDHVRDLDHDAKQAESHRLLAFTGIHVLDRQVLEHIPEGRTLSIIHVYSEMIRSGMHLKGFIAEDPFWHDIGTLAGYERASREALVKKVLEEQFPAQKQGPLVWSSLKGDGSDRTWYGVSAGDSSLVVVDHGLPPGDDPCEADAFFAIGRHLRNRAVPVPSIYAYDRPTGLVAVEDLGGLHFQTLVLRAQAPEEILALYKGVIDILVFMQTEGAKGFDPAFTFQTPQYDKDLILEKECRYFVEAFLNNYLGLEIDFNDLKEECELLAEMALDIEYTGFLHRDFQSRNILVKDNQYFVLDFQGGRLGPLAYDLASLLIDPYVALPTSIQEELFTYYVRRLSQVLSLDPARFLHGYRHCAVNRNLQILGAFAFLSKKKGKKDFEAYIPPAVRSLKENIQKIGSKTCKQLGGIIEGL